MCLAISLILLACIICVLAKENPSHGELLAISVIYTGSLCVNSIFRKIPCKSSLRHRCKADILTAGIWLNPGLWDTSLLQGTMCTYVHQIIYIYGQFSIANPPACVILDIGKKQRENIPNLKPKIGIEPETLELWNSNATCFTTVKLPKACYLEKNKNKAWFVLFFGCLLEYSHRKNPVIGFPNLPHI